MAARTLSNQLNAVKAELQALKDEELTGIQTDIGNLKGKFDVSQNLQRQVDMMYATLNALKLDRHNDETLIQKIESVREKKLEDIKTQNDELKEDLAKVKKKNINLQNELNGLRRKSEQQQQTMDLLSKNLETVMKMIQNMRCRECESVPCECEKMECDGCCSCKFKTEKPSELKIPDNMQVIENGTVVDMGLIKFEIRQEEGDENMIVLDRNIPPEVADDIQKIKNNLSEIQERLDADMEDVVYEIRTKIKLLQDKIDCLELQSGGGYSDTKVDSIFTKVDALDYRYDHDRIIFNTTIDRLSNEIETLKKISHELEERPVVDGASLFEMSERMRELEIEVEGYSNKVLDMSKLIEEGPDIKNIKSDLDVLKTFNLHSLEEKVEGLRNLDISNIQRQIREVEYHLKNAETIENRLIDKLNNATSRLGASIFKVSNDTKKLERRMTSLEKGGVASEISSAYNSQRED